MVVKKQKVRIEDAKVDMVIRKQYTENGFKYGYVQYNGEEILVCRDTTLHFANGVTYEWSKVKES